MSTNPKLEELRKKRQEIENKNIKLRKELENSRKEASSQDSNKSTNVAMNNLAQNLNKNAAKARFPISESEPIQIFNQKQEEKKLKLDEGVLTDNPENLMKFTNNIEDADQSDSVDELSREEESTEKELENLNQAAKTKGAEKDQSKEFKYLNDEDSKNYISNKEGDFLSNLIMVEQLLEEEEKDKKNEGLIEDYLFNLNEKANDNKRNYNCKRLNEPEFEGKYMINDIVWLKQSEEIPDNVVVCYATTDYQRADSDPMDYFFGMYANEKRVVTKSFRSEIKRIISDENDQNLIYGGIDNGRIALWDLRTQKPNPNSMSSPRDKIAFMPVIDLKKRENSIFSIALEGRIHKYDARKLDEPIFSMDLFVVSDSHTIVKLESMPTSLEFDPLDPEIAYVTTSEGTIYEIGINQNNFQEKTIYQKIANAPITNLKVMDFKNFFKDSQTCNYFITSSFDWNVKVFKETLSNEVFVNNYHSDFVTSIDVNNQLCPFTYASADVEGKLAVWKIDSNFISQPVVEWTNQCSISKIKWSSNGLQLAVGDVKGCVNILSFTRSKLMISDKMVNYYLQYGVGKLFSD